jgi:hypothetical protein
MTLLTYIHEWGRYRFKRVLLFMPVLPFLLALLGCGFVESEPEASGAVLVILGDRSPSGMAAQDSQRRHVSDYFAPLASEHEARVVVASIDGAALDEPEYQDSATFDTAAAQDNPDGEANIRAEGRRRLLAETDALFAAEAEAANSSDVAGALGWAATTLRNARGGEGWRGVAILSDAVSTAPPCNMLLSPPVDIEAAIAACFPAGVPDLTGVDVYFAGATAYPGVERPPVAADVLEAFWTAVVERGGGTLRAFAPTLLGESTSGESTRE